MKYKRERMVVLVTAEPSELRVGMNTAPTTGDEQASFTIAMGAEEEGSNRYTTVDEVKMRAQSNE